MSTLSKVNLELPIHLLIHPSGEVKQGGSRIHSYISMIEETQSSKPCEGPWRFQSPEITGGTTFASEHTKSWPWDVHREFQNPTNDVDVLVDKHHDSHNPCGPLKVRHKCIVTLQYNTPSGHGVQQTGRLIIINVCQIGVDTRQLGISFLWATAWHCLVGRLVNTNGTVSWKTSRRTRGIGLRINETSLNIPKSVWINNSKKSGTTHLASVKNASSTPSFTFADVSMKRMLSSSASSRPCSSVTARLSVQSDLLPIRILLTPSEACCSMFECQVRMSDELWVWGFWGNRG